MLFPDIPEVFADLTAEELSAFIEAASETVRAVTADPASFVSEEMTAGELAEEVRAQIAAIADAKDELARKQEAAEVTPAELSDEEKAEFDQLAAALETTDEADDDGDVDAGSDDDDEEGLAASAKPEPKPTNRRLPVPSRDRQPVEPRTELVPLVAAAGAPGTDPGDEFPTMEAIADAMRARRRNFGMIPEGTSGEKIPIARASWRDQYPQDRKLDGDFYANMDTITAALEPGVLRREFDKRREGNLVASGGLCAPVTPYYNLQMISQAMRPVRAALPAFNAERGGIRFARPAALSAVTTGVGVRTAAADALGGTFALKSCQVIPCPAFQESDVQIIYHCLQFGNLGARTFPELLTQWNNLVLAAHARLAETELLTGIDTASTQVTAGALGLGASATLFSQIMAAGSAMRSRNRMDPEAILRIMLPWWAVYLIVSDVFRGQFQRFDVDQARVVALLRSIDVEPTFYIDGAIGRAQVFGAQSPGSLLSFPATCVWYLFPEGSFLFLDSGTLELGLVRDSILNETNDFQIFGETFENVAFIGVESMAVVTTTCDSGAVSNPATAPTCPISY